ncbi:hypothetical protein [Nocardioides sp.]|uniref:hypothetical protein n=1 Tax=Nocardioides sp. TaxID=35761 RepID=UPI0035129AF4
MREHLATDHPEDGAHHGEPVDVPGRVARVDPASLAHRPRDVVMLVQLVQRHDDDQPWLLLSEAEGAVRPVLIDPGTAHGLVAALGHTLAPVRGDRRR